MVDPKCKGPDRSLAISRCNSGHARLEITRSLAAYLKDWSSLVTGHSLVL